MKYTEGNKVHLAMANNSTQFIARITKVSNFGATQHYGFTLEIQETGKPTQYQSGWMPCSILDAIAIPVP